MMQLTATHTNSNNDDVELTDSISIDAIDNASESNEVNNELTLTNTISDDTTQADPMPDVTDSHAVSPSTNNNAYSFIKQRLLSLNPLTMMALRRLSYHNNFHPHYFCYDLLSLQEQVRSYHHGLFFFSAQPCVLPPSLPFVIAHSHLLCYL